MQRSLYDQIGRIVEESVEAAVIGPPLIDFTGFMVIDLPQSGGGRPAPRPGEMISAPVGSALELSFFVMRNEQARGATPRLETAGQFFIAEPINIEGGRPAAEVLFEAVADSPTLQPQPGRQQLRVGEAGAETVFVFAMPERPGRHEIWFQLYQGGRLIQAVTVNIEATAEQASVEE
jgi:hypothetical protein